MIKYFSVQAKRLLRYLPGALLVALLLFAGIWIALQATLKQNANSDQNKKIQIAFCGQTDDTFLQMGLSTLTAFDNTRFSMELTQMDIKEAKSALAQGRIAAYIVIPEGFMDAAMSGSIMPLDFVSTTGSANLVSIFKEELSKVISSLLVDSQKGVFGLWDAMHDNGLDHKLAGQMDQLSLIYVDYILSRDHVYRVEELGLSDALDLGQYLLCGLGVVFFLLMSLPFAPAMILSDSAMGKMLQTKGLSAFRQALCEFLVFTIVFTVIPLVLLAVAGVFGVQAHASLTTWDLVLRIIPVILTVSAFSYLIYSIAEQLISGVLLHFFLILSMCFVSGCMYPVFFFPPKVQQLAALLPAGLARTQLATCLTGANPEQAPLLLGYSLVFVAAGIPLRMHKVKREVHI